ncbi:CCCH-type zinc finger-containing protein [Heterostelium album PN500]|uniref:CCCH-type zinc finger-containing protein n=1 Tax=Heterostelium pallidum (strain ATCC 26659 / Pp 5 / PN500) TaxID=670386 RepID=D3B0E0_HETP5|nr:CCCH-type zinc finger-containing protein [Heterostelium album PN500]EFA84764.1 CCCH-type zinc finger-containing protein [Heterostelium album PN500]|eukprot:XP_020436876.1 CCCH-type zinc finger-containing protein [Heterostelium album PN500]
MLDVEVDLISLKLTFDFEPYVTDKNEILDDDTKDNSEVCRFFLKGNCTKGNDCPYKHSKTEHAVVCKHWLRGLCKKGELCEFLHEYDLAKMPECYFFSKFGECSNQECMYLHLNPEEKVIECPWYARGFCKHGPKCRHKHVKKLLCENFYLGFCPEGPRCKYGHPKFELPKEETESRQQDIEKQQQSQLQSQHHNQQIINQIKQHHPNGGGGGGGPPSMEGQQQQQQQQLYPQRGGGGGDKFMRDGRKPKGGIPICHNCGQTGHKSNQCSNPPNPEAAFERQQGGGSNQGGGAGFNKPTVDLGTITCFKCFQTGHYANKCQNKKVEPPPGFNPPPQQQQQQQQQQQHNQFQPPNQQQYNQQQQQQQQYQQQPFY